MAAARNLREQLKPIAAQIKKTQADIRPVSQVTVKLMPLPNRNRMKETVQAALRWINHRAGRPLPPEAWDMKSFEMTEIGSQRTAAAYLPEQRYWSARIDDADKDLAQRTWITEIGVAEDDDGSVLFGARLTCTTRGGYAPFERSIPGFVHSVLTSGPAELDGIPILGRPVLLSNEDDIDHLVALIENPDRCADVILFSLPSRSNNPNETAADANEFHRSVRGLAHTFVVTADASFKLTKKLGKEFSVFHQSVRIYHPKFNHEKSDPYDHPLITAARIANWGGQGAKSFVTWLINQTIQSSAFSPSREERLPSFNTIRRMATQAAREQLKESGASDTELLSMYEEDNNLLRREIAEQKEEHETLLELAEQERDAAIQEAAAAKARLLDLRNRIRQLEKQQPAPIEPPIPQNFENFADWAKQYLSSVEIHPRALQTIKRTDFADAPLAYRALLLLDRYYVPMRIEGGATRKTAFDNALAELRLTESKTGVGPDIDPGLYTVVYGNGRRALDRHLQGSNSRLRQHAFRVYFFWDEEAQTVVVGEMPEHLDNRMS